MKIVTAGIDIGGTNTVIGLVDRAGIVHAELSIITTEYGDFRSFIKTIADSIKSLLKTKPSDYRIEGIGIGAPNANYYRGTIENAANLQWKGILPFVEMMREHFSIPIVITNDANAAAIGEMVYGGARKMKDFIVITLGTGLGSGLVANGELIYGHDGFAGELGHTLVQVDGRKCGCGNSGCLETYVSASGIKRTVFELLSQSNAPSEFRTISFDDLTAVMISQAAEKGDPIAVEAFQRTGTTLGMKLADAVAHTSPEAIFLFGGLANAGKLIVDPTKAALEKYVMPCFRGKVKILVSELLSSNAAILGASALAWHEIDRKI